MSTCLQLSVLILLIICVSWSCNFLLFFLSSFYNSHTYSLLTCIRTYTTPGVKPPAARKLGVSDIINVKGKPRPDVLKAHFVAEGRLEEEAALHIIHQCKLPSRSLPPFFNFRAFYLPLIHVYSCFPFLLLPLCLHQCTPF